jgi:hypothetical protein
MKVGDYVRHVLSGQLYQYLGNNRFVELEFNFFGRISADASYKETVNFIVTIEPENVTPIKILILEE